MVCERNYFQVLKKITFFRTFQLEECKFFLKFLHNYVKKTLGPLFTLKILRSEFLWVPLFTPPNLCQFAMGSLIKYPAEIKLTKVMDLSVWIIQKSKIQICFVFEFRESTKVKKRQQKSSQPSKTLFFLSVGVGKDGRASGYTRLQSVSIRSSKFETNINSLQQFARFFRY